MLNGDFTFRVSCDFKELGVAKISRATTCKLASASTNRPKRCQLERCSFEPIAHSSDISNCIVLFNVVGSLIGFSTQSSCANATGLVSNRASPPTIGSTVSGASGTLPRERFSPLAHSGARLTPPHVGSCWRKRTMGGGRGTPVMSHSGSSASNFAVMHNQPSMVGVGCYG